MIAIEFEYVVLETLELERIGLPMKKKKANFQKAFTTQKINDISLIFLIEHFLSRIDFSLLFPNLNFQ